MCCFLGEANQISSCAACKNLTWQALGLHQQRLKSFLWEKSLEPPMDPTPPQPGVDRPSPPASQQLVLTPPIAKSKPQAEKAPAKPLAKASKSSATGQAKKKKGSNHQTPQPKPLPPSQDNPSSPPILREQAPQAPSSPPIPREQELILLHSTSGDEHASVPSRTFSHSLEWGDTSADVTTTLLQTQNSQCSAAASVLGLETCLILAVEAVLRGKQAHKTHHLEQQQPP